MFAAGFTTHSLCYLKVLKEVSLRLAKAAEGIVADKAAMKVLNKKLGTYPTTLVTKI